MEYTLTKQLDTQEQKSQWSGIIAYADCNTVIVPEIDGRGQVATGLTPKDARELEIENGMDVGTLGPASKYWFKEFGIPFNGLVRLDDENPSDKIKLAVLRSMKKVAVGRDQLKKKSKAIFLLTSRNLETKTNSEKFDIKEKAWKLYFSATDTKLKQIAVVLEKTKVKGKVTDTSSMDIESVKNKLRQDIETQPAFFISIAEDEDLGYKFEALEYVTHRVLSVNSTGFYQKSDLLAPDLDGMATFLKDPHNQPRVIALKTELKTRKANK